MRNKSKIVKEKILNNEMMKRWNALQKLIAARRRREALASAVAKVMK